MTAQSCEVCFDTARKMGKDENQQWRQFCDFHAQRARADRVIMSVIDINKSFRDKRDPIIKPVAPPGML